MAVWSSVGHFGFSEQKVGHCIESDSVVIEAWLPLAKIGPDVFQECNRSVEASSSQQQIGRVCWTNSICQIPTQSRAIRAISWKLIRKHSVFSSKHQQPNAMKWRDAVGRLVKLEIRRDSPWVRVIKKKKLLFDWLNKRQTRGWIAEGTSLTREKFSSTKIRQAQRMKE